MATAKKMCRRCGSPLEPEDRFCPECGYQPNPFRGLMFWEHPSREASGPPSGGGKELPKSLARGILLSSGWKKSTVGKLVPPGEESLPRRIVQSWVSRPFRDIAIRLCLLAVLLGALVYMMLR